MPRVILLFEKERHEKENVDGKSLPEERSYTEGIFINVSHVLPYSNFGA